MRTCKRCKKKYEDSWKNWYNRYYCWSCYREVLSRFKKDDIIYTYVNRSYNQKQTYQAKVVKGKIIQIYKMHNPTTNGFFQYGIQISDRIIYRYEHHLFENKKDCEDLVNYINNKRQILYQLRKEENIDV